MHLTILLAVVYAAPCLASGKFHLIDPGKGNWLNQCYYMLSGGEKITGVEHAKEMQPFGFEGAKWLLERYQHLIPKNHVFLEVGPYYNPLFPILGDDQRRVVWEFDTGAGMALVGSYPGLRLFQVDLRELSLRQWREFDAKNREVIEQLSHKKAYGGAVISSVLNYVDYRETLQHLVPLVAQDGLLIIANSTRGDGHADAGTARPTGIKIFEFLVREFPNHLQVLEGSQTEREFADSMIRLAARISWDQHTNSQDLYRLGIEMLVDQKSSTIYGLSRLNPFTQANGDASAYIRRFRPYSFDTPDKIERWTEVRKAFIERELAARRDLWWMVSRAGSNWRAVASIKETLTRFLEHTFYPERYILLEALQIKDLKIRREFLDTNLRSFLAKAGHQMPTLDGPRPTTMPDDAIDAVVQQYRILSQ